MKTGKHTLLFTFPALLKTFILSSQIIHAQIPTEPKISIDTIVNVAFGKQNSVEITSSIAVIAGDELYKMPASNLLNSLYGKIPGLTVIQGSGEPGYDSPALLLRGKATYKSNTFPVYVDGFEASFDQLSVSEIETISVLKDAASLALLGISGANGAIWVTTKRGMNSPIRINFRAQTGFQSPLSIPKFLGSYNYALLYNEAMKNDDGLTSGFYSPDALNAYKNHTDPVLYPDVNWYNEVLLKHAPTSDASLSFTGGSGYAKYFVLVAYNHNTGFYKNTDSKKEINSNADFQRYNFRSNVDIQITKNIDASVDLSGRIEDRAYPNFRGATLWNNMAKYPSNIYPVKNPTGTWGGNTIYPDNPVASILARGYTSTHDRNLMANFRLSEKLDIITSGLTFKQAISFSNWFRGNYNKTRDYARYQPLLAKTSTETDTIIYTKYLTDKSYSIDENTRPQWNRSNIEASINYANVFGKNRISGMMMYHQETYNVSGNIPTAAKQGISGRINYGFNSNYFAEFGFAYYGSDVYPKGKRYGLFPSISVSWILSNEPFFKNKTIRFLKIRASIGLLGNDSTGRKFLYEQNFTSGSSYLLGSNGGTAVNGITEGTPANPAITWEKSKKINLGMDVKMFGSLELTADLFFERRTAIPTIRSGEIPIYIGVNLPLENIGKVSNKGFELEVIYHGKAGKLNYFLGSSLSYAHNTIDYQNEVPRTEPYLYRTGKSIGQQFGLEAIGFFNSWKEITNSPTQTFTPVQPGDLKYKDQNNDGYINESDEIAIGYPEYPEITYTFNIGADYKGFDLALFFQGVANRSVYLNGDYVWAFVNNNKAAPNALNRWTEDTKETANYPRLTALANDNNYRRSTFWIKNGNFLRLRSIEFGYTFPIKLLSKLKITNARIYINEVNLFTWDKIDNLDPETMSGYPFFKSYNMGFSLNF